MKIKKQNIILLLIVIVTLLGIKTSDVQAVYNEENVKTYGHFQYIYIQETDSIEIVGYVGNEKVVVIPAEIEGKPVRVISNFDDYFDEYDYATANGNVREIYIPNGVLEIYGFSRKKNLEKVYVGDSVQVIGIWAFDDCKKLKEVKMPAGLIKIEHAAFAGCSNLKKITIPHGVKEIEDSAFASCESLKEIYIPDSVTEIGEEAFCFCKKLTKVRLSDNLKVIKDAAFYGCNIKNLQLPQNLKRINYEAFCGNPLTKITIPSKVTHIEGYAFGGCSKLKKVIIKSKKLKKIEKKAFGIHSKAVFDVPNRYVKKYKKLLTKSKSFKEGKMKIK